MKIIQHRERIESTSYNLFFAKKNVSGAGWAPPCDKDGNVLTEKMAEAALLEWERVKARLNSIANGQDDVYHPPYIQECVSRYTQPAIGLCDRCGDEVYLEGFTNTCHTCGADYDMSGQLLADRSQWGEETGESLSDILSIK